MRHLANGLLLDLADFDQKRSVNLTIIVSPLKKGCDPDDFSAVKNCCLDQFSCAPV